jgi:hypothetical protein
MARHKTPSAGPEPLPEPGPALDARIARIERRALAGLAGDRQPGGRPSPVPIQSRDVLLLIRCLRELLRDREALLEEIEALESGAGRPRSS